jgi:hypothetical protein
MDDGTRTGFGYEVIQARNGGAAAGNHVLGVTGIRFQSIRSALLAAAQACGECEEWRVVEIPPGEPLDYDGCVVAKVEIERFG